VKRIIAAAVLVTGGLAAPSIAAAAAASIGEPAVPGKCVRTIRVNRDTRYVHVSPSETVNLVVNGTTTTWKFDGNEQVVNLREIVQGAPNAKVYITSNFPAPAGD
jgi:hypothetical protein